MYKFCKDIGRGNFSKVKLAVHQLTRGMWSDVIYFIINLANLHSEEKFCTCYMVGIFSERAVKRKSFACVHFVKQLFQSMWDRYGKYTRGKLLFVEFSGYPGFRSLCWLKDLWISFLCIQFFNGFFHKHPYIHQIDSYSQKRKYW